MNKKLPYYMAYPLPLQYDDERIERRDYEYMQSLYPDMAKKILPYVEDECDRMEYKCSMMYDEYPDRLQLRMMSNRVFDEVIKNEKLFYGNGFEDVMEEQQIRRPNRPPHPERPRPPHPERPRPPHHDQNPNWLQNLIEVMLYNELHRKRRDHRRYNRRIY